MATTNLLVPLEVTIAKELAADLDWLVEQTGRSKAELVREALEGYIRHERAFIEAVNEGIRAADAGEVVSHEEVVAEFERWVRERKL